MHYNMICKKLYVIFFLFLAACPAVLGHERVKEFQLGWISDQHVLGVNKEDGHASYIPYASRESLTNDPRYKEPWLNPNSSMYIDLNGIWKFRWVAGTKDGPAPSEWQAADLDDSQWDKIRLPMNWEMDSRYNLPTYNNTGYPHFNEPPYAMRRHEWKEANPLAANEYETFMSGEAPCVDWSEIMQKQNVATRAASANVLAYLSEHVGNMIVSSADLCNSDKTDGFLKHTHVITPNDFTGRFLQAGVSELTMA